MCHLSCSMDCRLPPTQKKKKNQQVGMIIPFTSLLQTPYDEERGDLQKYGRACHISTTECLHWNISVHQPSQRRLMYIQWLIKLKEADVFGMTNTRFVCVEAHLHAGDRFVLFFQMCSWSYWDQSKRFIVSSLKKHVQGFQKPCNGDSKPTHQNDIKT